MLILSLFLYKFNDFIQAIHRIYRFLQTGKVIIDIIYTANEQSILDDLLAKWDRFKYQSQKQKADTIKDVINNMIELKENALGLVYKED